MSNRIGKNIINFSKPIGKMGFLSMKYPSPIISDNLRFHTCEQYVMYRKIKRFNKTSLSYDIHNIKKFERSLSQRDHLIILFDANLKKFSQNGILREQLLETEEFTLLYTSPSDKKYGIGMSINDLNFHNPLQLKNKNLLGQVLMGVRRDLQCM